MKIFITGGTGSLGTEVINKLLADETANHQIFIYSRDEFKQALGLKHERITKILGDIRDATRLVEQTRGMDMILHLAALKRVDSLEENPEEAIQTNVIGTMNVLQAQRMNRIPRVVLSSTDKAVAPINTYGATKLLSENLVLRNGNNVVCRYGNVIASRGSAVSEFCRTLRMSEAVYITDKRMTRFWITLNDAADFVLSGAFGKDGGLKIPDIRASSVLEMASAIADRLNVKDYKVHDIGIRPGEKLHESLSHDLHSNTCQKLSQQDLSSMLDYALEARNA